MKYHTRMKKDGVLTNKSVPEEEKSLMERDSKAFKDGKD